MSKSIKSYDERSLSSGHDKDSQDGSKVVCSFQYLRMCLKVRFMRLLIQGTDLEQAHASGKTQRMINIRKRRQEERIQKILVACSTGDLAELKVLLKVSSIISDFKVHII